LECSGRSRRYRKKSVGGEAPPGIPDPKNATSCHFRPQKMPLPGISQKMPLSGILDPKNATSCHLKMPPPAIKMPPPATKMPPLSFFPLQKMPRGDIKMPHPGIKNATPWQLKCHHGIFWYRKCTTPVI
jgi:hypothetical protein